MSIVLLGNVNGCGVDEVVVGVVGGRGLPSHTLTLPSTTLTSLWIELSPPFSS